MAGVRTRVRRFGVVLVAAAVSSASAAAPAAAVRDCPGAQAPRVIKAGQGSLEAVTVDGAGRIFYSASTRKAVMRLDAPEATPVVLAGRIESPGGLVFHDGSLLATEGNSIPNGAIGNLVGLNRIWRVDPDTGARSVFATGVSMGNGLARGPGGEIYASDDIGVPIDRIAVDGRVERGWASVLSPNGLAVDPSGRWLYAAQTFVPAAIARIRLSDPRQVETYVRPGPLDIAAGLDGMTIDADGRLYVAANGGGEVWRVGAGRSICALARGLRQPSAVALRGGSAIVVGFDGRVLELPGAVPGA